LLGLQEKLCGDSQASMYTNAGQTPVTQFQTVEALCLLHCAMPCCAVPLQLEAELRDLEQQSAELQVEGQDAIQEYKVRAAAYV
jgi:hypothetical protein